MRGILFPNSNIIFDAQNNDPTKKKEDAQFGNPYGGWQNVENAAISLAEASNGPMVQQTTQTLKAVQSVMARIDSVLGTRDAGASGRRLDSLTTNLGQLTAHLAAATNSLNDLLKKMTQGEGTLGRMATDTMLYKNLTSTLAALSALLTDLKERPGRYLTVKVF